MRRRELWTSFTASAAGALLPWHKAVTQRKDPRERLGTDPEASAGVTPLNREYPLGDLRRYGAVGDGIAEDSMPWQRAIAVGVVIIPPLHSFRIVTPASRQGGLAIQGSGQSSKLL